MKNKAIKNYIIACIGVILIAPITYVFAEQVLQQQIVPQTQQPSTIELQVNSENENDRKQAFTTALSQLLIKNSNNPKIIDLQIIKTAISNPSIYVQHYSYISRNITANQRALYLQIQFDQTSITQLLKQATQPEQQTLDKQSKKMILRVTNVNGLEQCNEVVRYLTTFGQVTHVDLSKISASAVELSLSTIGDQQTLLAAINAQNKLVRNINSVDLEYKWVTVNNEQPQAISIKPLP